MDLFIASYPLAQWDKILQLRNQDTAKARAFNLLRTRGWTEGERLAEVAGFDFRTRCSRLRDLGIPVETTASDHSPCYLYRIPRVFLMAFEEKEREKRRAAA